MDTAENRNVTVKVLVIDGEMILLTLDKEKPTFNKRSMWGMPGGRMDPEDEDEFATGIRETLEETGIAVKIDKDPVLRREERTEDHLKVFLVGRPVGGQLKAETEETDRSAWVPKWVLFDQRIREEHCPKGIYSSHTHIARELLRSFWEREKNKGAQIQRERPVPASIHPPEQSKPSPDPITDLRLITDAELSRAVGRGKPVYCLDSITGRRYGGTLVGRERDPYLFKGSHGYSFRVNKEQIFVKNQGPKAN